uniref:Uncharacterized protein n=1 Tax=Heliothis virescens TaxID=7102 RepID=A0A2A4JNN5_HELVI
MRITCLHLPLASKWVHVGTERGNVHVVNIETFALSGYVINWNKAIEVQSGASTSRTSLAGSNVRVTLLIMSVIRYSNKGYIEGTR